MSVCLAKPKKEAVHKVRTQTRRIEAQLELLRLLKGLPKYKAEARKVLRQLKKLRRAAGRVRDLDIAQQLIEESAAEQKAAEHKVEKQTGAHPLEKFRKRCRKGRKRAARKLEAMLEKGQVKVSKTLEALMKALEPAEDRELAVMELEGLVEQHFKRTHGLMMQNPSTEQLHTVRKAAKVARYMAENAPDALTAARKAKRFEAVQEAGGAWHDWLDLAEAAADELGEKHAVAVEFAAMRDERLAAYRVALETVRGR